MKALRVLRLEPLLAASPAKPKTDSDLEADSVVPKVANAQEDEVVVHAPTTGTCPTCQLYYYPNVEYRTECHQCATVFCWACGIKLENDAPEYILHLQWWNVFGCRSLDKPANAGHRAWDVLVLDFVAALVAGIPSLVVGALVGILSGAFLPCVVLANTTPKHAFVMTVNGFSLLVLVLVVPATMLLMLPFYPISWAYRRVFPNPYAIEDWMWHS